mmetsp:Transcript_125245/g.250042  ORF Transcript_125245/g.250042 Transcript_125245/m.250042 type:complete len:227 (-) Transcript_125245:2181-2861(-)
MLKAAANRSSASSDFRPSKTASMNSGHSATACWPPMCSQKSTAMWRPKRRPGLLLLGPANHFSMSGRTWGSTCAMNNSGLAFMQAPKIAMRPIRASCSSNSSTSGSDAAEASSSSTKPGNCATCSHCLLAFFNASSRWKLFIISDNAKSQMPCTCMGWRQPAPAFFRTLAMPWAIGAMSSGSSALTRSPPTLSTNRCTSSITMSWAPLPFAGIAFEIDSTRSAQQG